MLYLPRTPLRLFKSAAGSMLTSRDQPRLAQPPGINRTDAFTKHFVNIYLK